MDTLEDRNFIDSTLVTSQFPINRGYELIGDPTLADAILDCLVYTAYKIELKGGSMRNRKSNID